MYPGLQPSSHLPVVTLHAFSFKQCSVQRYRHPGPYVPDGHSRQIETNIINIIFSIHLITSQLIKIIFSTHWTVVNLVSEQPNLVTLSHINFNYMFHITYITH